MSNAKDFVVGAAAIALSFVPGVNTFAAGYLATTLFAYGSAKIIRGIQRATLSSKSEGIKSNILTTQGPLPVVYGYARVGMKIVDTRLVDATDVSTPLADPAALFAGADNNDILARVGAFCVASENGSGVEDITNIRFQRDGVDAITDPYIEDLDGLPSPNDTPDAESFGLNSAYSDHVKYVFRLGTDTQDVPVTLQENLNYNALSMRGRGIAYAAFFLRYDTDIWRAGIPSVTALVKGNKVYDPRDSTWKWSDNPALCVLDYLTSKRYGGRVQYPERDGGSEPSAIDEQSFIDAANYCDEVVAVGYGPTQKRFRLNGAVDTDQSVAANLTELLATCRGELVWQGGKYRLVIRQATTATSFKLNENNIVGEWEWRRRGMEIPNAIEGTFLDEQDDDYVPESVTWPLVGDTALIDADNGVENKMEVDLHYCTNYYQALQTIMTLLREARQDVMVMLTANQEALQLQVGDVVPVSHGTPGWTDKLFTVVNISIRPDKLVRLALQEYDATAYSLDSLAARATVPGTNLPDPFNVDPPINLSLTSDSSTSLDTQDGQRIPRILVVWQESPDPFLNYYEVEYKVGASSTWESAPNVPKDRVTSLIGPVTDGQTYDIRVIAVNHLNVRSDALTGTITAGTEAGSDVRLSVVDLRESDRTLSTVTYEFDLGTDVDSLWVYEAQIAVPNTDPWATVDEDVPDVYANTISDLTFSMPPLGSLRYIKLQPKDASNVNGPVRRLIIQPLAEDAARVIAVDVDVDDVDGSVVVAVSSAETSQSIRYAYAVGNPATEPNTAAVEAGTIVLSDSYDTITLPADTVGLGEEIIVRVAGYINTNGTGPDGTAQDRSDIVTGRGSRTPFRVPTLQSVTESESGGTGTMTVQVNNPDALTCTLFYRTKSGTATWGSWTSKVVDPADGSQHTETVTLQEKHQSFIQWRLDYSLDAETNTVTLVSGGFDAGAIPNGVVVPVVDETNGNISATAIGDVDTAYWKILGSNNAANITPTNVRAELAINGRILTPTEIGTLVNAQLGERIYIGAYAYNSDDEESTALFRAETVFLEIAPTLEITTETESGSLGTFGVTVDDPGGQAGELQFRTKSGTNAWTAWTQVAATAANNTEYIETVSLVELHPSFVEFRLYYTLNGQQQIIHAKSSAFDAGLAPSGTAIATVDGDNNGSAALIGDFDTVKWKVAASKVGYPDPSAETPIDGRVLTPTDLGVLVSGIQFKETLYVSAIPIADDNTEGATVYAESTNNRTPLAPVLEVTTESEDQGAGTGTFTVTLRDPDLVATAIDSRVKVGANAWTSYQTEGTPTNGANFTRTVTLSNGHLSFVEFKVTYIIDGVTKEVSLKSSGFDAGFIPNGTVVPTITEDGVVSAHLSGDLDTLQWKFASSVVDHPNLVTVQAESAVVGRDLLPADVGTLDTIGLTETLYISALPIGEGGVEGNLIYGQITNAKSEVKVLSVSLAIDPDNNVDAVVNCDEGVYQFWAYANETAYASIATTKASGANVVGTSGTLDNLLASLSIGETAYVTVVAENQDGSKQSTLHRSKIINSSGTGATNYINNVSLRWVFATAGTFKVRVEAEIGPDVDKITYFYTDPDGNGSDLLPTDLVTYPYGVTYNVPTPGTVQVVEFDVEEAAGGIVEWSIASANMNIQLTPRESDDTAGTMKPFTLGEVVDTGEGGVRVRDQATTDALIKNLVFPANSGLNVDTTTGEGRVVPSDFIKIQTADPSTGWGTDDEGKIWVKPT